LMLIGPPDGLSRAAWACAALLVLMATWWATEAIPIAVTALLPLAVLPLFGVSTPKAIAQSYSDPIVLLLMAGFMIALGLERWGLHRRIALNAVAAVPGGARTLIASFMIATALISMWISNTATTLMMLPIALSAASVTGRGSGAFSSALLLGICYAASIGGLATPVGTPTNLIAIQLIQEATGKAPSFVDWMKFGVPAMVCFLPVAWWLVTRNVPRDLSSADALAHVRQERSALGKISANELRVALVFGAVAAMWIARGFLQDWGKATGFTPLWLMGWTDTSIAIAGVIAMFLVPAKGAGGSLLRWEDAVKIPWGVVLLFGGGIALGGAIETTGLAEWLGEKLSGLAVLPLIIFLALVVALIVYLSEVMSNVATMTTIGPILGAVAVAIGASEAGLFATAALAASCGFMLPAATGPNAVVYGTGQVPIRDMLRAGFFLDLAGIVIIVAFGVWLAPIVFSAAAG
jgi:solute carrier family 13 (sodium-dependent dicarboxylate transporter), member 2/3/5